MDLGIKGRSAIRLVYPMMKAQRWGRIVNLIGGAGKEPDPYMFGSGITNSALLNITKSLSTAFGARTTCW